MSFDWLRPLRAARTGAGNVSRPRATRLAPLALAIVVVLVLGWARASAHSAGSAAIAPPRAAPLVPVPRAASPDDDALTIYAAASLTNAFQDIANLYTSRTGWPVAFNLGASSTLRAQLEQGAVADLFASADAPQMDALVADGLNDGAPVVFAQNRLVVVLPASNPAAITSLHDLARPGVKLVTTNPQVPIGAYTLQVLDKLSADPAYGASFRSQVEANVVSHEENVRAILSKVALGEADAGIVYVTDVAAAPGQVTTLAIPDPFNVAATYPMARLRGARHADQAQLFQDLVLSPDGQAILAHYEFVPVGATSAPAPG